GKQSANKKWRAVYGTAVPKAGPSVLAASAETASFRDTEEFVEDQYPVDIRYSLAIDCRVTQDGFQPRWLRRMISDRMPLRVKKTLD
ncbi:nucleotide-binding domain-containing protein, partial [Staphylococcus saprophyticus]|uniref:nucleotide-binding domain-containing protein n=1 Tax=Staphylococcus saprophyticus TaxID=29385 RepID=UPI0030BDC135